MSFRTIVTFLGLICLSLIAGAALAQDEIPLITYNQIQTHQFTESGEQYFAQFEGKEGDVVYLLADYTDFVIGDLELDLRDSVGRTVGFKDEYAFDKFVIAELPNDGMYTVVISAEEAESVDYIVGLSGYLESGVEASITNDSFQVLFLVLAEQTGDYSITYERKAGDMGTQLTLVTFSKFFSENAITMSGTSVNSWSANITLTKGDRYVAFLDRNFFTGGGSSATVFIKLSAE